jgi:hypothetical protein
MTERTSIKTDADMQKKEHETLDKKVSTAVTGNEIVYIRLLNFFFFTTTHGIKENLDCSYSSDMSNGYSINILST